MLIVLYYLSILNYRHKIKSMDKQIFVEKHFHSNGHDFNRDAKSILIERIGEKKKRKKKCIGQYHCDG